MGNLRIMAQATIVTIIFLFLSIPTNGHLKYNQEGHVSAVIFKEGLDFGKDLLIKKATSSMIPLQITDIERSVKIPVIGKVFMALSNITIDSINISDSDVETGVSGLRILGSGASASLSMNWRYSYKPWLVPKPITDKGSAFVEIEGMKVGVYIAFEEKEGALELSTLDSQCSVQDLSIDLDGGASWLYQGLVDAFEGRIRSAVENVIEKKIREGITTLDAHVQSLPKQLNFNGVATMNATFIETPLFHKSSVELLINGLFNRKDKPSALNHNYNWEQAAISCKGKERMFGLAVLEEVLTSLASVYFNANYLDWIVDKAPNESILNTAGWRDIVPELYEQYPNAPMNINVSVTSPPVIHVRNHGIDTTVNAEVTIDVLNLEEFVPLASMLLEINASGSAEIWQNNFAGGIRLVDLTATLKWTKMGTFNMVLLKPVLWTAIETVIFPIVNHHLRRGLTLPIPHGYELRNAELSYLDSTMIICTDGWATRHLYQQPWHTTL